MPTETVTAATHVLDGTLGVDITSTGTSATTGFPKFPIGYKVVTSSGAVYEYIHASGAITQYFLVKIGEDGEAESLATSVAGSEPTRVGIAQVAHADNAYGFVLVQGPGTVKAAAGTSNNAKVYTHTTLGYCIGASTGTLLSGLNTYSAGSGTSGSLSCFASVPLGTNLGTSK